MSVIMTRVFSRPCLTSATRSTTTSLSRRSKAASYLNDLPEGSKLEIQTENRHYRLKVCNGGEVIICGHPEFCPQPVTVKINGSSWGGSMLKVAFIGRGMHLEFRHPVYKVITTSPIVDIRAVA